MLTGESARVVLTCEECGTTFWRYRSHAQRRDRHFCSNPCRMTALQRVPRPLKGKGKGFLNRSGYRYINIVNDDGSVSTVPEHRYVMEQHIGRAMRPEEVVHHINGVRDDNRIENLELFATHAEHISTHHHDGGPKPTGRWSREHDVCVTCGRSDSPHSSRGRCHRCNEKARRAARR